MSSIGIRTYVNRTKQGRDSVPTYNFYNLRKILEAFNSKEEFYIKPFFLITSFAITRR